MVTGVDFLPAEYWKRRASQRDQYYLLAIAGALILLLVGSFGRETHKARLVRTQRAGVEAEYADVLNQVAEVSRLEERCAPLALDATWYALVRARPSVSRSLVAVASSCPPHVTLQSVALRRGAIVPPLASHQSAGRAELPSRSAVPNRRQQLDGFAQERERTARELRIDGISASDPDVTELVARLERSECFAAVTFNVSDNPAGGPLELRKFTIQCLLSKVLVP